MKQTDRNLQNCQEVAKVQNLQQTNTPWKLFGLAKLERKQSFVGPEFWKSGIADNLSGNLQLQLLLGFVHV